MSKRFVPVRWTLTDAEHRAYRQHLATATRWPLWLRLLFVVGIAGGFAMVLALGTDLEPPVIVAFSLIVLTLLFIASQWGKREPAKLPPCTVVLGPEGYESAGAKQPWSAFGGIDAARVVEHPGGVLVVRVEGQAGWAELPLTAASRPAAERACRDLVS
jgi:hypothetical protein